MNSDWFKDAIIYQTHIKAFFDANGDGIGDFEGLRQKLDYLTDLGVTCLWLLPFYPSPMRDDGYDIADYREVHPSYGTLRDFRRFVADAHKRNLRIITEMVLNHTSDQHPWFQRARRAKAGSAAREFYVWSDNDEKYRGTRIIFSDAEKSNWTWDPVAKQYYWHRFFSHQPDLNFANMRVIEAMIDVMRFWFNAGVDGMRLDAVPYLCEREGTSNENLPETHSIVKILRAVVEHEYPGRIFLAEANQWPEDLNVYFGDDDEAHMCFHFPLMPRLFLSVAEEDRYPIYDIMHQTPPIPEHCQWALFLRNHDELTLEMVTERERELMQHVYATEPRALLNMGIRRRLAPLMENDRRKIELMNGILMSLPGTPVTYYGDEIGMGDNVFLGDRDGVRTPMQWSPDRNAGFSTADPHRLYLPPIMDAVYGYGAVNVEAQTRSRSSLLNWMKRIISIRKASPVFGRGSITFLYPANRHIMAFTREYEGEVVLCVVNLSGAPQAVQLDLARHAGRYPLELFGPSVFPVVSDAPYTLTLPGYSFYWFSLVTEVTVPRGQPQTPTLLPELVTLVLPRGFEGVLGPSARLMLAQESLPRFLARAAWFPFESPEHLEIRDLFPLEANPRPLQLALVCADGDPARTVALALDAYFGDTPPAALIERAISRLRSGAREGFLLEATTLPSFALALLSTMREDRVFRTNGALAFDGKEGLEHAEYGESTRVQSVEGDPDEVLFLVDDTTRLRFYRRPQRFEASELLTVRHLLAAGFPHVFPIVGNAIYEESVGERSVVAIAQTVPSIRGDAWALTQAYLERFVREAPVEEAAPADADGAAAPSRVRTQGERLGTLTAELHRALAQPLEDAAFRSEPLTAEDVARWRNAAKERTATLFTRLAEARPDMPQTTGEYVDALMARREEIDRLLDAELPPVDGLVRTRAHGDLHLGNILVAGDELFVDGFSAQAAPASPLRDLAALLTSIRNAGLLALESAAPENAERIAGAIGGWRREAEDALLQGYEQTVSGCPSVPADPEAIRAFVRFFRLDRSVEDVLREFDRRSTWLRLAVQGVLNELGA